MNLDFIENSILLYKKYIHNQNIEPEIKEQFEKMLKCNSYDERLAIWLRIVDEISFEDTLKISNPYFIGYGNPNAKTIIFGLENAIDLNPKKNKSVYRKLFFEENLNNLHHWEEIQKCDVNKIINRPYPYHNPLKSAIYEPILETFKPNHTWGIYSKLLWAIRFGSTNNWDKKYTEYDQANSIFNHFFLSEINHIPSKKLQGGGLSADRYKFLKSEFFQSFSIVIISARSYFKTDEKYRIEDIFSVQFVSEGFLSKSKNDKNILPYTLFESNNKLVVLINQLSGSAGWSSEGIESLSELLKDERKELITTKSNDLNFAKKMCKNDINDKKPDESKKPSTATPDIKNTGFHNIVKLRAFLISEVIKIVKTYKLQDIVEIKPATKKIGSKSHAQFRVRNHRPELKLFDRPPNIQAFPNGKNEFGNYDHNFDKEYYQKVVGRNETMIIRNCLDYANQQLKYLQESINAR